jgi:DNA-binding GntR family transcriptional regulator
VAEALDASVTRMELAAAANDVSAYYKENLQFHWAMVEAAGNAALAETYRNIVQKLHLYRLASLSQDTGMLASIAGHREIAAAQRAGNAARCEQLLAEHVQQAHRRLSATKI